MKRRAYLTIVLGLLLTALPISNHFTAEAKVYKTSCEKCWAKEGICYKGTCATKWKKTNISRGKCNPIVKKDKLQFWGSRSKVCFQGK